jgi:aromatic-ring opening dioxygenase LigAB LigA subunit
MSLYYLQKALYQLNRDPELRWRFEEDADAVLSAYELTAEERAAIRTPDIGLLYVLGVNGQILMHYAAYRGFEWNAYLEAMREGVRRHGPVRAGIYALVED